MSGGDHGLLPGELHPSTKRWIREHVIAKEKRRRRTELLLDIGRAIFAALAMLGLLTLMGCASAGPYTGHVITVDVQNFYRDPVDVEVYCGGGRLKKVRWLMPNNDESVLVRAPAGCEFRFAIEPSITGGPYTYTPRFHSHQDYESLGKEPRVCITVGSLITNSGALQGGCR